MRSATFWLLLLAPAAASVAAGAADAAEQIGHRDAVTCNPLPEALREPARVKLALRVSQL